MEKENKIWLVSVNMGYGHQRTAFPLKALANHGKPINANDYEGMPAKDRNFWEGNRRFYEFVSTFKRVLGIGWLVFFVFDQFQKITRFYPKRNLSAPNIVLKKMFKLFGAGWGSDLIARLKKEPLPMVNTFFVSAFMAEFFNYPGEIYCVVCDADISRTWASLAPQKSRIKYFAPNSWTRDRLKLYGVKEENIFLTGFPLPVENIGDEKMELLKKDIGYRLLNLDPERRYYKDYKPLVDERIGKLPLQKNHNLTLAFSIGGAGVQTEIVAKMLKSLCFKIKRGKLDVVIMAGTRKKTNDFFVKTLKRLGLSSYLGVKIIYSSDIEDYFKKFNKELRKIDILWTKPSELSFYTGLGVPIIIAPPVGSQEDFNKKWLIRIGAGIPQESPGHINEWLFDYLKGGRFAEAAMKGFISVEKLGVYNISKKVLGSPL